MITRSEDYCKNNFLTEHQTTSHTQKSTTTSCTGNIENERWERQTTYPVTPESECGCSALPQAKEAENKNHYDDEANNVDEVIQCRVLLSLCHSWDVLVC